MLTFVVVNRKESKGSRPPLYWLANKGGVLEHWIMQSYLTTCPDAQRTLMDLEEVYQTWKGLPIAKQRTIAAVVSCIGGQGKAHKGCGFKVEKCNAKSCTCSVANQICGSSCHKGK